MFNLPIYQMVRFSSQCLRMWLGSRKPTVLLILGSGLGSYASVLWHAIRINYSWLPFFPRVSTKGHKGDLLCGRIENHEVLIMRGRPHYHEGHSMWRVTYPYRAIMSLGTIKVVIITSAVGFANSSWTPGDLILVDDIQNRMGEDPLRTHNDERFGEHFLDITKPFDSSLVGLFHSCADEQGLLLRKGIYVAYRGPMFEPRTLIQDDAKTRPNFIYGMSMIPEIAVCLQMGEATNIRVAGLCCGTNFATGVIPDKKLAHREHLNVADDAYKHFQPLMNNFFKKLTL